MEEYIKVNIGDTLDKIIDIWEYNCVERKRRNMSEYCNDYLTTKEAIRHSDNIQNLIVNKGDVAEFKLMIMAAWISLDTKSTLENSPIEEPILVGYTTKRWGENGYHVCEIDTPVYEFEGQYFINSRPIDSTKPVKQVRFYKDRFKMLKPLTDVSS